MVGEKWKLGVVIVDCSNETEAEVVEVALLDALDISILVVMGCFGFRTRGGTPPFCPLPFGMFVVKRIVTLGVFSSLMMELSISFSHSHRMGADTKQFPVWSI